MNALCLWCFRNLCYRYFTCEKHSAYFTRGACYVLQITNLRFTQLGQFGSVPQTLKFTIVHTIVKNKITKKISIKVCLVKLRFALKKYQSTHIKHTYIEINLLRNICFDYGSHELCTTEKSRRFVTSCVIYYQVGILASKLNELMHWSEHALAFWKICIDQEKLNQECVRGVWKSSLAWVLI